MDDGCSPGRNIGVFYKDYLVNENEGQIWWILNKKACW